MEYSSARSDLPSPFNDVLVSIHPRHARVLYTGQKTFELRKSVPRVVPRRMFLYETDSARSVTGHLIVERVISGPPEVVWRDVGTHATSMHAFTTYFAGKRTAFAFEVGEAVHYRTPISAEALQSLQPGFRPSQNFLYLQNLPALQDRLDDTAFAEGFAVSSNGLVLKELAAPNARTFLDQVTLHIAGNYRETAAEYGPRLLSLDRAGRDQEGIFTRRKAIREIWWQGQLVGFVVITTKLGGSLKTGPTVLFEEWRGKGVGQELRRAIHSGARRIGARKVYCTGPVVLVGVMKYLVDAGYRVEAHLRRQYHAAHDELVFGYMLTSRRGPGQEFLRPIVPLQQFTRIVKASEELTAVLRDEFSATFFDVSSEWAARQVREAVAWAKGRGSQFKARILFAASGLGICAVALCAIKRGGGCKLVLLTRTAHRASLRDFIFYVEGALRSARRVKCAKMYTHVPVEDVDLVRAFVDSGYRAEGILERPYNEAADVVVLGKVMPARA